MIKNNSLIQLKRSIRFFHFKQMRTKLLEKDDVALVICVNSSGYGNTSTVVVLAHGYCWKALFTNMNIRVYDKH